jgi:hypothetical protein
MLNRGKVEIGMLVLGYCGRKGSLGNAGVFMRLGRCGKHLFQ